MRARHTVHDSWTRQLGEVVDAFREHGGFGVGVGQP